jgi:hypothetical protein
MASTILNRVSDNLLAAGVSRAVLATVCGVKPPTLAAAYAGTVVLGGHREAELLTVSHRILDAATACKPFDLPRDAASVAVLVNRLRDGTLTIDEICEKVSSLFW